MANAPWIWRVLKRLGWAELIYGQQNGERTLYLARLPLTPMTPWGQLLFHTFYRGDEDPDPHDHPWAFWTRPLGQGYYEEVMDHDGTLRINHVRKGSWHWRDFTYTHRVLFPDTAHGGSYSGYYDHRISTMQVNEAARAKNAWWPLHTLVWRGPYRKVTWGFWVLGNNPILDRIGWNIQSNPCTTGRDTTKGRMKVPFRTYIYGEEQTEPL